jgi:hypothetical protein
VRRLASNGYPTTNEIREGCWQLGFSDGIIRLVVINQNELTLIKADKVLKRKIILMKCSPDGATLSAMDDGGDLFFLSLNPLDLQDMKPYCLH